MERQLRVVEPKCKIGTGVTFTFQREVPFLPVHILNYIHHERPVNSSFDVIFDGVLFSLQNARNFSYHLSRFYIICDFCLIRVDCLPIPIPSDDPHFNDTCMEFVRSAPAPAADGCEAGMSVVF